MKFQVFLVIIIFFSFELYSQPGDKTKTYTLKECLQTAMSNNPDIGLANANLGLTSADVTSAFGDFLPSLSFNSSYTHNFNIPNNFIEANQYDVNGYANYTIFNGFSRESNYNRAKTNQQSLLSTSQYTAQRVSMDIYRQFVNVIRNYQLLKIRKENYDLGQKDLEKIKARYEAGVIPVTNVLSQEADLGSRELDVVKAENDLNISKATILSTMGLNPSFSADFEMSDLPYEVYDLDISKFREKINSADKSIQIALDNRLDYQSNKSAIKAAEYSITMSQSRYYPTLTASGGWDWSNSFLSNSNIKLNLSVPIFENFKANYSIEQSKLQVKQLELQLFSLEQSIKSSIKTAYYNLDAAEKQLEISEKRSLTSAQKNFENASERYKLGAFSISDYFLANNLLVNAQINHITAVYGYYIAQKEILFAIGNL